MSKVPLFRSRLVPLFFLIIAGGGSCNDVAYSQIPGGATAAGPFKKDLNSRPGAITVGAAQIPIPDTPVLDQNGKRWRLYTDLIKDKVVVVSFFFTTCIDACPTQGMSLARLQSRLGERFGKDVFFVSISMDPATDTPERLKKWADAYSNKPGWTLVTGDEAHFTKLVHDFTGERLGGATHLPVLLIGNDRTGRWARALPESRTEKLVQLIDSISKTEPSTSVSIGMRAEHR